MDRPAVHIVANVNDEREKSVVCNKDKRECISKAKIGTKRGD